MRKSVCDDDILCLVAAPHPFSFKETRVSFIHRKLFAPRPRAAVIFSLFHCDFSFLSQDCPKGGKPPSLYGRSCFGLEHVLTVCRRRVVDVRACVRESGRSRSRTPAAVEQTPEEVTTLHARPALPCPAEHLDVHTEGEAELPYKLTSEQPNRGESKCILQEIDDLSLTPATHT